LENIKSEAVEEIYWYVDGRFVCITQKQTDCWVLGQGDSLLNRCRQPVIGR